MRTALLIALLLSLAANVWLGKAVVRLEKYHYASMLGSCGEFSLGSIQREQCLAEAETRTSWAWHLYYGLGGTGILY